MYKARLVARSFTPTYGVDYFETFSPVARLNSIRILFSLAANQRWSMYELDVKNTFLCGALLEQSAYRATLRKAIYGLKQSPCTWFTKFSEVVKVTGFKQCSADHSVFVRLCYSDSIRGRYSCDK